MNLKFWKKDDFSDYKLPPLQGAGSGSDLGLPSNGLSDANNPGGTGLDLSGGFQPGATPFGNSGAGASPFASSGFAPSTHDDDHNGSSGVAPASQSVHGKDLEVIAAKLDAIKSQLDMLNLRLSTLEQRLPPVNQGESGGPKRPWY